MSTATDTTYDQGQGPAQQARSPRRQASWALVAAREIQVKLRDRNFLMSTGLTLLLLIAALLVQQFLGGGAMSYKLGVTDAEGARIVAAVEQAAQAEDAEASVTSQQFDSRDALVEAIRAETVDYGLARTDAGWELMDEGPASSELQMLVSNAVHSEMLSRNAEAAGTDVGALMEGTSLTAVDLTAKEDGSNGLMAFILGFVFAMLFYMASLMFGQAIASSVVEEKQSRLVEILAAVIPTRSLLIGKVLGNTALAFGQLLLIVAVGLIGLTFTEYDIALPGLVEGILWFLPFFVLGFIALACVWAAAGSMASRMEDLQSTTLPLTMILVVVFVVGMNLRGTGRVIGSFVPVLSTILMPMRILEGKADWWEPVAALLIVIAFCAVTIWLGARLYQRSLLHTSGSLTWRKAFALKE